MNRLPVPGSDDGVWGQILNDFLLAAHQADGTLKPGSITGGHIQNGTVSSSKLSQDIIERIETLEEKVTRAAEIANAEVTLFNVATPVDVDQVNGEGVELATRFYTTIPGQILGIRFYKGPLDTGLHTGSLRAADGTVIETTTFSSETPSGWQYQAFTSPVTIAANTEYLASYFNPTGHFVRTARTFTYANLKSTWLVAPMSTAQAPNGLYRSGVSGPPDSPAYQDSCYFVDVVFRPTL